MRLYPYKLYVGRDLFIDNFILLNLNKIHVMNFHYFYVKKNSGCFWYVTVQLLLLVRGLRKNVWSNILP